MMTFPQNQSNSESSDTLEHLNRVRLELLQQLRNRDEMEPHPDSPEQCSPGRFSLFSSPRNYREDELANGLTLDASQAVFGKN